MRLTKQMNQRPKAMPTEDAHKEKYASHSARTANPWDVHHLRGLSCLCFKVYQQENPPDTDYGLAS